MAEGFALLGTSDNRPHFRRTWPPMVVSFQGSLFFVGLTCLSQRKLTVHATVEGDAPVAAVAEGTAGAVSGVESAGAAVAGAAQSSQLKSLS